MPHSPPYQPPPRPPPGTESFVPTYNSYNPPYMSPPPGAPGSDFIDLMGPARHFAQFKTAIYGMFGFQIVRGVLTILVWGSGFSPTLRPYLVILPLISIVGCCLAMLALSRPQLKRYCLAGAFMAVAGAVYPPFLVSWPVAPGGILLGLVGLYELYAYFDHPQTKARMTPKYAQPAPSGPSPPRYY